MPANSEKKDWLQRLVSLSVRRPRSSLFSWLILCAIATLGVADLRIDTGTSSFLDKSDPAWFFYRDAIDEFGGDEVVVLGFAAPRPFDPEVVARVAELSDRFEDIQGVRRVDSIASVPIIAVDEDGFLSLDPAVKSGVTAAEIVPALLERRIAHDRMVWRNLVSEDGSVFAINIYLDSDVEVGRDRIVREIGGAIEGNEAWISGVPVFRTEVNTRTRAELILFVPLTLLLVAMVVFGATRDSRSVLAALGASGIGTWVLLGVMGFLGAALSLSTMILPSILLALGCAYGMHLLSAVDGARNEREIGNSISQISRAVGLSGLTTAIGFLAISTVNIDAIRELGLYGAIGVIMVLFATLSFIPSILTLLSGFGAYRFNNLVWRSWASSTFIPAILRYRRGILVCWGVLLAVFCMGLVRLYIETDIILWFAESSAVRRSYNNIRSKLSGITPVNVVVSANDEDRVVDAVGLSAIHSLSSYLGSLPIVGKAVSIADPLIQIHKGFNSELGDSALPLDRNLVSQYLLLLSSVDQIQDVLSSDRRRANIILRLTSNGSKQIMSIEDRVNEWWEIEGPEGFSVKTTGIMYEFGRSEEEIAYGQLRGFTLAFCAVATLLTFIFRKPGMIFATLVPNLLPLVVAYGFMGIWNIPLDAATICLGSLALGIAVDDTLHVATEFATRRDGGASNVEAISGALHRVFPALVYSSAAIAIGFAVIGFSEFTLIRNLGLITSAIVVICLLADLTLLPALLTHGRNKGVLALERGGKPTV